MPLAVYVLGISIFAQGTSELMLAGLLTEIAADLGVSIPRAGLLISGFALGMLIGAPMLAVGTLRWPRRDALLGFLGLFVIAHVVGALTSDYWILFGTRVISAFVYAGFWALAAATAVSTVAPTARGKAMSIVAGGLTIATIVGLPAGTVLGQQFGWRSAFWAVALLSALSMIGVFAAIPGGRAAESPRLRGELRAMASPRLWLSYGTTALSTGSIFVVFAYLGALLADTTGLAESWIPAVLGLYGLGSLVGIVIGGRTSDKHPFATLYAGAAGMAVVAAALALTATIPAAAVVLVFLLGAFGFATNPALNTRVFALAEAAPTLAAATNFSAFNVGITVGPWLGGLAIGAGYGYASLGWLGATLALAMLATVLWADRLHHKPIPAPESPAADLATSTH
ncbi:Cmx/CmrA family chloramphenicol efflux MFS transporter [Nocardia bhagyanarayanae]|uniref:DHA1 family chloramphenicol resistance protein-like MFS transporter n=1 Tax=Nocardia bhagyanarayanae TaxID=1215925 RepID=A0A543EWT5_9NOCA|nr:Cmx/CmrA family chloramphenicol efflux MFS transporter [Nocardia bhagyanarayanae]TQM26037.1 DHA1 family chloramphenicol resistance protein-like MFS transporter [Nocardia bhagyanarayanae]